MKHGEVWLVFQSHASRNVWRLHSSMSSLSYGVLERRRVPKNAALKGLSFNDLNCAPLVNVSRRHDSSQKPLWPWPSKP